MDINNLFKVNRFIKGKWYENMWNNYPSVKMQAEIQIPFIDETIKEIENNINKKKEY